MIRDLYVIEHGHYDTPQIKYRDGQHEFLNFSDMINYLRDLLSTIRLEYVEIYIEKEVTLTYDDMIELVKYNEFANFESSHGKTLCEFDINTTNLLLVDETDDTITFTDTIANKYYTIEHNDMLKTITFKENK
jgi:hypothetical protein